MVATHSVPIQTWKELQKQSQLPDTTSEERWRKFSFRNFHPSDYSYSSQFPVHLSDSVKNFSRKWEELSQEEKTSILEFIEKRTSHMGLDYFVLQSLVALEDGIFVSIPRNLSGSDPLELSLSIPETPNLYAPFLWVDVGENSQASLYLQWEAPYSHKENFQWLNPLILVNAQKNSNVSLHFWDRLGESVFYFRNAFFVLGENAYLKNFHSYFGGFRAKSRQTVVIEGRDATTQFYGLSTLKNKEFWDHETEILHQNHHQNSSLVHKVVGKDRCHHIFTGNLVIPPGLSKVKAAQVNHNLLLNPKARLESIPKLEIFSEDVQSSHGSTVGEISEEQVFYLLARGVPYQEAIHILTEAFLLEILDSLDREDWKEKCMGTIREVLWPSQK